MLQVQQRVRDVTTSPSWRAGLASVVATPDPWPALEPLGTSLMVRRGQEIYAEGDPAEYCYKAVEGCIRTVKLLADGSRQIGDILLPGDFFGFESGPDHYFAAQAVSVATLRRYPRRAIATAAVGDTEV